MIELIRHYVQHGDPKCSKCIQGFTAYWIKGFRDDQDLA